ncbi:hypothetical protein ACFL5U_02370, partial [Candidatus Margulisiibacteriota bacterium]
ITIGEMGQWPKYYYRGNERHPLSGAINRGTRQDKRLLFMVRRERGVRERSLVFARRDDNIVPDKDALDGIGSRNDQRLLALSDILPAEIRHDHARMKRVILALLRCGKAFIPDNLVAARAKPEEEFTRDNFPMLLENEALLAAAQGVRRKPAANGLLRIWGHFLPSDHFAALLLHHLDIVDKAPRARTGHARLEMFYKLLSPFLALIAGRTQFELETYRSLLVYVRTAIDRARESPLKQSRLQAGLAGMAQRIKEGKEVSF